MASAAVRTFAIPELLEQILLALAALRPSSADRFTNITVLLRARGVSQTFKNTVDQSPELQRVLWIRMPCGNAARNERNPFVMGLRMRELANGGFLSVSCYTRGDNGTLGICFGDMIGHDVPLGYWLRMYPCSTPDPALLQGRDFSKIKWQVRLCYNAGPEERHFRAAHVSGTEFVGMTFGQLLEVGRGGELTVSRGPTVYASRKDSRN